MSDPVPYGPLAFKDFSNMTLFLDNYSYNFHQMRLKLNGQLDYEVIQHILFQGYSTSDFDKNYYSLKIVRIWLLSSKFLLQFSLDRVETRWIVRPWDGAVNIISRLQFTKFIDLLFFSKFHRHILKNRTMLFPTTFISVSEKIDVGLKKHAANFYFNFTRRRVVRYSCFDFFLTSANWRYFSYLGYEILI